MSSAIEFRNVDIIFGEKTDDALKLAHDGVDRSEILKRTGAVLGATQASLTLGQAQVGDEITVVVRWRDDLGNDEFLVSTPTVRVANVNDAPTGKVKIGGVAAVGARPVTPPATAAAPTPAMASRNHQVCQKCGKTVNETEAPSSFQTLSL